MAKKEEKLYTTGEVAKMFSIKKDTLFYYDRIGLFSPNYRKGDTNYRYYSSGQIKILDSILSLRGLGIPIEELRNFLKDMNAESFLSLMDIECKKLEDTINNFKIKKNTIQELSRRMKQAKSIELGKLYITKEEAKHYFALPIIKTGNGEDEDWFKAYETLWNCMEDSSKVITIGSILPKNEFLNGNYSHISHIIGYTVSKNECIAPKGMYANIYVKGQNENLTQAYSLLKNELQKEGYIPASDLYEEYVIESTSERCEDEYITLINVMVEKI